jgi:molybdopterin-guanine dinucleotide biosynthesis protein B
MAKVFGIVGWKNSGKTTMVVELVKAFRAEGYRVSTVKHAHHVFDVDHKGTDSYKHREAGAAEVVLVSRNRWVLLHELRDEEEPTLADMMEKLEPSDLVLVEGFKSDDHPKLEVLRKETLRDHPIWEVDDTIKAVVSDDVAADENCNLPVFSPSDVTSIVKFIKDYVQL